MSAFFRRKKQEAYEAIPEARLREYARLACDSPQTIRIELRELGYTIGLLEKALERKYPALGDSVIVLVRDGIKLVCPTCGEYSREATC